MASTNNRAWTVLPLFLAVTEVFHFPRQIRTDLGTENIDVASQMLNRYRPRSNPVLTGKSVDNYRIERLWRDVHNYVIIFYKNLFLYLDEIDLYALYYTFLPQLLNLFLKY